MTLINLTDDIQSLIAICLDINTPEDQRVILRKELKDLHNEINKTIAQYE